MILSFNHIYNVEGLDLGPETPYAWLKPSCVKHITVHLPKHLPSLGKPQSALLRLFKRLHRLMRWYCEAKQKVCTCNFKFTLNSYDFDKIP